MRAKSKNCFGTPLRRFREKTLNVGLNEFCDMKGFDPAYITRIETGMIVPSKKSGIAALVSAYFGEGVKRILDEWYDRADLAAGRLPRRIVDDEQLPRMFGALAGLTKNQWDEVLRKALEVKRGQKG